MMSLKGAALLLMGSPEKGRCLPCLAGLLLLGCLGTAPREELQLLCSRRGLESVGRGAGEVTPEIIVK